MQILSHSFYILSAGSCILESYYFYGCTHCTVNLDN